MHIFYNRYLDCKIQTELHCSGVEVLNKNTFASLLVCMSVDTHSVLFVAEEDKKGLKCLKRDNNRDENMT